MRIEKTLICYVNQQEVCRHQQQGNGRDLVPSGGGLSQGQPARLRVLDPLRRGREADQGDGHARHHGGQGRTEDAGSRGRNANQLRHLQRNVLQRDEQVHPRNQVS